MSKGETLAHNGVWRGGAAHRWAGICLVVLRLLPAARMRRHLPWRCGPPGDLRRHEDQLGRLRELLAGSGIPFGMYIGKTPEHEGDVTGRRLKAGASRAEYQAALRQVRERGEAAAIPPPLRKSAVGRACAHPANSRGFC